VNGPSVTRAVDEHRETMRRALHAMAMQAREIVRLKAELAGRDAMLAELQAMIGRLT
jgi:hypothetical protein